MHIDMFRWSIALLLLPLSLAAETGYRAGVTRIDITPPIGHPMGGYSERKGPATGTHDPLYATVLVIESGHPSIAFVALSPRSLASLLAGGLAREHYCVKTTINHVSHTQ